jgi:peptidyl-prolyl cis-trans isomerase C
MNYRLGTLAVTSLLTLSLLVGCNDKSKDTPAASSEPATSTASVNDEDTLATVNGSPITKEDVVAFMQIKQQTQPQAQMNPGLLLNEMINTQLLVQEAEQEGLQDTAEVKRLLKIQRAATLVNVLVRNYLDNLNITDEELKKEYDEQIAAIDKQEFKASHILLENEADAKKVIAELKPDGSNFAELAKKYSTGPSAKDGGELGWFSVRSMVPEFSDAVKGMKKGEISKTPVQSEFGWHVIYLEDVRTIDLPTFEQSKDRLKLIVAQKKLQEHIAELREKADIQIKGMEPPAASKDSDPALEADKPVTDK